MTTDQGTTADRGIKNPEWFDRYHAPENAEKASADLARRVAAAGLDCEAECDLDTFRDRLARWICMCMNDYPGCPERICRRMHGCMAPNGSCENHRDDPPMTQEEWDEARVEIRRALDARIAELGGVDALELQLEREAEARAAARRAEE